MHLIKFVSISKLILLASALAHTSTVADAQENAEPDADLANTFGRVGSPGWAPSFPGRGDDEFIEYVNENEIDSKPSSSHPPAPAAVPAQPPVPPPVEPQPDTPAGRNDPDIFETTRRYEPPPTPPPKLPWYKRIGNYAKKKWNEFKYRWRGYTPL